MRKENSTNLENEKRIVESCAMAYTVSIIDGRWKSAILWQLIRRKLRYNELRKAIPAASERILVLQLRELERDGLIKRTVYPEVPPKVEYELTEKGITLKPVLKAMTDWGKNFQPQRKRTKTTA
jgi:DNA-binding HxlR family transcriptional regulator